MKKIIAAVDKYLAFILLSAGIVLSIFAFSSPRLPGDTDRAATRMSRMISHRMKILDSFIDKAMEQEGSDWLEIGQVPEDMVIYRYVADTLQSWCNQFPIINDEINSKVVFQRLFNPRVNLVSPLSQVTDSVSFIYLGTKAYLVKSRSGQESRIIAGLDIMGRIARRSSRLDIRPLTDTGGSAVIVGGRPQFKLVHESLFWSGAVDMNLLWIAFALFFLAAVVYVRKKRTICDGALAIGFFFVVSVTMYLVGRADKSAVQVFSPVLYAGGDVLYSLGAVFVINAFILLSSVCTYLVRADIFDRVSSGKDNLRLGAGSIVVSIAIMAYANTAARSIILNSGISLEIYKIIDISPFSILIYVSFITLLLSVPLLLTFVRPFNPLSLVGRIISATMIALFLVITASSLGFRKEQDKTVTWAGGLSVDRDFSLEILLRRVENQIAEDMIISSLSVFPRTEMTIQNRIKDNHLSRLDQDYDITVFVFNEDNNDSRAAQLFNAQIKGGEPMAENSHFLFVGNSPGHAYYLGVFLYYIDGYGVTRVLVRIEQKDSERRGYASIFGFNSRGRLTLPAAYSYARYEGRDLKYYKGSYAYPTLLGESEAENAYERQTSYYSSNGYIHFCNAVTDNQLVIISRAKYNVFVYAVSVLFLAIVAFFLLTLISLKKKDGATLGKNYYKSRITAVLMGSLIFTLVAIALFSILFVYKRNESNLKTMMSEKINAIVTMFNSGVMAPRTAADLNIQTVQSHINRVADNTASDITLYGADGRLMMSTTQRFFDRMLLGNRVDGVAYDKIIYQHSRYYIAKSRLGKIRFYSMYAPIIGENGDILAILSSPYSSENYDFERDAITHSLAILSIFLLLLLIAIFVVSGVVDRMFKPLSEMSLKMSNAGIDSLEYVDYNFDDEVSTIVQAYNRMVTELKESTRKLALAERDKAWSGMARQVAHEIKNPLTPMRLQLQRLIRLKQKGDPAWIDCFDEASKVLVDHIDILTGTANEFSTFAKLYTEEPVEINLDRMIKEELSMFDNRDDVMFDYFGLKDASILGPKPQLIRVIVNLLTNSVQAVEGCQDAKVMISLRNSVRDGFYDIVVEDNGPGVSEENVDKLFTPNFTTKNGGSGLGLAISRSILDRCGATIKYSRSFVLNGACFTIQYPKPDHFCLQ